ncbi:hypothetical protein GGR54DRAFT_43376 [Hypoxylon sp. NC1633]|nr:hypothetical protein GGR54DRAFT_43376 [Hypoxylon sp. NC1633]
MNINAHRHGQATLYKYVHTYILVCIYVHTISYANPSHTGFLRAEPPRPTRKPCVSRSTAEVRASHNQQLVLQRIKSRGLMIDSFYLFRPSLNWRRAHLGRYATVVSTYLTYSYIHGQLSALILRWKPEFRSPLETTSYLPNLQYRKYYLPSSKQQAASLQS